MSAPTPRSDLGRHVFGVAVLGFGLVALAWPDIYDWLPLRHWNAQVGRVFVYAAAAAQIVGGAAIQFRRTAKTGAVVLGAPYLVFALLCLPQIVAKPQIYNSWNSFFEQFSFVTGAAIVYGRFSPAWAPETVNRIGRVFLGACAASFGLEQAFYLNATASLVPKWFPPSQLFWAIATTVAFGLAAVALLTNRAALLAARLLTAMLLIFGVLVWIPLLLAAFHDHTNWSETAETFAIAGVAWVLADLLGKSRLSVHRPQ